MNNSTGSERVGETPRVFVVMLTVKDVAERLRISPTCVYQLIDRGKLPCHRIGIGRGAIRVCETDLVSFLGECREESSPSNEVQRRRRKQKQFRHLRLDG
jgi:excisionase family DNA binding protein